MTTDQYNQLVDKHADGLYRFVLKTCNNSDKAKDIVQDSFERLWQNVSNIDAEKAKSYLFTTAYHIFVDTHRKDSKQERLSTNRTDEPMHTSQYSDLQEVLHRALNQLPEIQRSVVLLRDYEGYSYDEISEITGLSESQVKVYIFRARVALKEIIGSPAAVLE